MKYNEESYKKEVTKLYNGEIKIIGKYKGLYKPSRWEHESSTETFTNDLLPLIKDNLKYDIVSTSSENLSSKEF